MMVPDVVPRQLRAEWVRAGYYPGKDLYRLFADRVAAHPTRVAVIDDVEVVDYARLGTAVGRLANCLAAAGVAPGDVVAVQLPNGWLASAVELAVWAVGGICLAYPTALREHESRTLLKRSEAVVAVVASAGGGCNSVEIVDAVRHELPALHEVFVAGGSYGDFTPLEPVLTGDGRWSPPRLDPDGSW